MVDVEENELKSRRETAKSIWSGNDEEERGRVMSTTKIGNGECEKSTKKNEER